MIGRGLQANDKAEIVYQGDQIDVKSIINNLEICKYGSGHLAMSRV